MDDRDLILESYEMVVDFFVGDEEKANDWFDLPNPLLGGLTPNEMIETGQVEKLHKFILTQIEENGV